MKVCEYCGKIFDGKGKRFCSRICFSTSQRTLKGTIRKCTSCGCDYEPHHKAQKCCSDECARNLANKTKRNLRNTAITKQCVICGQDFHPRPNIPNALTCSKYCKRQRDAIIKRGSGYKESINRKRYVKVSGTESEPIDRIAIYQRDKWICQICGKKVNPKLTYPNPESASLDHILPFALGGSHIRANVQLAHLRCNIKKSDSSGGQLRLLSEV